MERAFTSVSKSSRDCNKSTKWLADNLMLVLGDVSPSWVSRSLVQNRLPQLRLHFSLQNLKKIPYIGIFSARKLASICSWSSLCFPGEARLEDFRANTLLVVRRAVERG
ncbi:hypothetical protein K1719_006273 [Acacia pycnantha]|nr:hypothetical protein K1719_006273 [Acacia pycnantha]